VFIPYKVDVPFDNRPVTNWLVFAGVILVFGLQVAAVVEQMSEGLAVEKQAVEGQAEEEYRTPNIEQGISSVKEGFQFSIYD